MGNRLPTRSTRSSVTHEQRLIRRAAVQHQQRSRVASDMHRLTAMR